MFRHRITLGGICKGMIAGAIGGAAGAWAMNDLLPHPAPQKASKGGRGRTSKAVGSKAQHAKQQSAGGGEEPTVKVAEMTSRKLFDHELTEQEKQVAGPAVHYGMGMSLGAIYGGLAELWPNVKIGMGMGYGMAVWALASETALPALSLSPPPTQVPVQKHADTLSAHVCYGLTLDFVRRVSKVLL